MAKRSREDFESLSPDSDQPGDTEASARLVIYPSTAADPSKTSSKILHLESESGEAQPASEMICSLPPHRQTLSFATYEDYEVHYLKTHTNRCTECRKNFPTEHFLNLHIEENHDSLVSVRKERGEKTVSLIVLTIPLLLRYLLIFVSASSTAASSRIVTENAQLHRKDECT
jgi:hypothetical protein